MQQHLCSGSAYKTGSTWFVWHFTVNQMVNWARETSGKEGTQDMMECLVFTRMTYFYSNVTADFIHAIKLLQFLA